MPALERIRSSGVQAVLRSTVPTYTPPAWVSMITGVNPGRHGVFGFLATTPQEHPKLAHSGSIAAPTMWRFLQEANVKGGFFNIPMSYPPVQVNGFMLSGGLAAGWTDTKLPNFASKPELGHLVTSVAGGSYPLDTVVSYENDWRSRSLPTRIEEIQRLRRRVLGALLEREEPAFLFAVFEGPDRLQHLHYQYLVECSDWYSRPEAAEVRERALSYFSELDSAIADLVDWAGQDGNVFVVSDHGFGPWEKTVNLNLLLEQWGYLRLPSVSRLTRIRSVAGVGQRAARRLLPRSLLHSLKSRIGRNIAWDQTRAFASHVAEQGIHVNAREDVPKGILDREEATKVEIELLERLQSLVDPDDGEPVVDRIDRREDVIHGAHANRAPRLFPFCRNQRYELSDTLAANSPITDHRDRPWGYHHEDGIFIAKGQAIATGTLDAELDIVDILPTVFHAAGLAIPIDLDGRIRFEALAEETASRPVVNSTVKIQTERNEGNPYSPEEEASIEESLRGLGYLD
jgi:predicted AlkP superfamily phosphohydrolase/phosphomutase